MQILVRGSLNLISVSGVYYEPNCFYQMLDHGVTAVGYGTDKATHNEFYFMGNSRGELIREIKDRSKCHKKIR